METNSVQGELEIFNRTLLSFRSYSRDNLPILYDEPLARYNATSDDHKKLLPRFEEKLNRRKKCIRKNQLFLDALFDANWQGGAVNDNENEANDCEMMSKVRLTIKQCVRDWSLDGKAERDAAIIPVIDTLNRIYSGTASSHRRSNVRVLVCGAGLSRLAYDIALQGYTVQGNEFSYHMLACSHYVLNCIGTNRFTIYPWIYEMSNVRQSSDTERGVLIPDTDIGIPGGSDRFSMIAGEFCELYNRTVEQGKWNSVVTCFFIDTGDVLAYLDTIHFCLATGGHWINFGPLLWHHEGKSDSENRFELTYEEIKQAAVIKGFRVESDEVRKSGYCCRGGSMLEYTYNCAYTVFVKE